MSWSLKLFTVRGIPVRVHASFLLVLLLVAGAGALSRRDDWLRDAAYLVAFVALLFVCVALHELGHSLVAQFFGGQVQDITLWPIGGMARVANLPRRPYQEFLIAAAGPATNLVLAVVFGTMSLTWIGAGQALQMLAYPQLLNRFLATQGVKPLLLLLTINNVVLALFNLIPAFPMDGGRLLRSFLAVFLPFGRATQVAAFLGQILAALMGITGLLTRNFLLGLVGLFVFVAAWQERRQVQIRESLQGVSVRQTMQSIGLRLRPWQTLGEAAARAAAVPQAGYLVVDNGRLIGVLLRNELLAAVRRAGPSANIAQYIRPKTLRLGPDDSVADALERLLQSQDGFAIVVQNGEVIGTLAKQDVLRLVEVLDAHPDALMRR